MKRAAEPGCPNGQPERLLERYNRGYSTASELMLGVLTLTKKSDIETALRIVPKPVFKKLRHFVGYYTPETKVFNGPPPKPTHDRRCARTTVANSHSAGGKRK